MGSFVLLKQIPGHILPYIPHCKNMHCHTTCNHEGAVFKQCTNTQRYFMISYFSLASSLYDIILYILNEDTPSAALRVLSLRHFNKHGANCICK